jgi:hypothetical protein
MNNPIKAVGKFAKQYTYNALVATDELVNCVVLGGAPSDTISGRAERGAKAGVWGWKQLHGFLDWLQPDHCETALADDETGRHVESINLEK